VKYPLLAILKEFLLANGAEAALMSGSGSAIFGLMQNLSAAQSLGEKLMTKFGRNNWIATVSI
jgi:4-diphosphocytidyl-2C-methyl-D-erythritol kinase